MKNRILALVGLALLAAGSAYSQNQETFQVDVPFAFQAGSHTLPAGRYEVRHVNRDVVRLEGPGGAAGVVMIHLAIAPKAPASGNMVFHQIGNRYFLAELWSQNETNGDAVVSTRAEREALAALKSDQGLKQVALNAIPAHQTGR
jgi:hypothetical protein